LRLRCRCIVDYFSSLKKTPKSLPLGFLRWGGRNVSIGSDFHSICATNWRTMSQGSKKGTHMVGLSILLGLASWDAVQYLLDICWVFARCLLEKSVIHQGQGSFYFEK